ncbi:MAG: LuxR C-terminal-related transcriptional regulator [Ferruginibacter sp.]
MKKWICRGMIVASFLFTGVRIAVAQTDGQIQKIYDFYAAKNICYEPEILFSIKKFSDIGNDSLKNIIFDKLYRLIKKKPDAQVKALVLAVDSYHQANEVNNLGGKLDDLSKLNEAVKIALSLNNEVLLARIYAIYGNTLELIKQPQNAVFYLKKANNIFLLNKEKCLGLYKSNCFDLAKVLYQLFEYVNCIEFGKEMLALLQIPHSDYEYLQKIQALDLVGASYKCLGKADSSISYYKNILSLLKEKPLDNLYENDLWTSIAYGNIGENLLNKGRLPEATPYIEQYYNFNRQHRDIYNIFLSTNLRARLYAETGNVKAAEQLWESVIKDPASGTKPDLIINAANGLAKLFAKVGQTDSALFYQKMSMDQQASVQRTIYQSGLKAAENRITFERMESSLGHSEEIISKIKLSRNLALFSLLLLVSLALALGLWNRSRWKYKLKEEELRNEMASRQIEDSRLLLDNMTQSLVEKSKIVEKLSERLSHLEKSGDMQELREQLAGFALTREEDWQLFLNNFERVHPAFLPNLNKHLSGIYPAELRLSVLMKVGLTNIQIADSLGISPASVSKSKYRLKQRLELEGAQSLENYIRDL